MTIRYIRLSDRMPVEWLSAELKTRFALWHATVNGKTPLCGLDVELTDANPYPGVKDRGMDICACRSCQSFVRRVGAPRQPPDLDAAFRRAREAEAAERAEAGGSAGKVSR